MIQGPLYLYWEEVRSKTLLLSGNSRAEGFPPAHFPFTAVSSLGDTETDPVSRSDQQALNRAEGTHGCSQSCLFLPFSCERSQGQLALMQMSNYQISKVRCEEYILYPAACLRGASNNSAFETSVPLPNQLKFATY